MNNYPSLITYRKSSSPACLLFCFHYAGGSASVYRDWHKYFPDDIEIICVQLPGRENRFGEPPISNIEMLKESISKEIEGYSNDVPFVMFGHSMGAILAYQISGHLKMNRSLQPSCLIVSGAKAPADTKLYYNKISDIVDDEEFISAIAEYGGIPQSILDNPELIQLFTPILRADFELSQKSYNHNWKFDCPIHIFGGISDKMSREKLLLWALVSEGSCNVTMFNGGHFFINEHPIDVIERVKQIIEFESLRPDL